tara:strand:+ start:2902 stop:3300 length:399 start_codon:yes stop_codon:yes gene_type:complete
MFLINLTRRIVEQEDDIINGKRVYEWLETFSQDFDDIDTLNKYYLENKDSIAKLKAMSPRYYDKLIAHFKALKTKIVSGSDYFIDVKVVWTQTINATSKEKAVEMVRKSFKKIHNIDLEDSAIHVVGEKDNG